MHNHFQVFPKLRSVIKFCLFEALRPRQFFGGRPPAVLGKRSVYILLKIVLKLETCMVQLMNFILV